MNAEQNHSSFYYHHYFLSQNCTSISRRADSAEGKQLVFLPLFLLSVGFSTGMLVLLKALTIQGHWELESMLLSDIK